MYNLLFLVRNLKTPQQAQLKGATGPLAEIKSNGGFNDERSTFFPKRAEVEVQAGP